MSECLTSSPRSQSLSCYHRRGGGASFQTGVRPFLSPAGRYRHRLGFRSASHPMALCGHQLQVGLPAPAALLPPALLCSVRTCPKALCRWASCAELASLLSWDVSATTIALCLRLPVHPSVCPSRAPLGVTH